MPRRAVASTGDDCIAWAESIGWDEDEERGFYVLDDWQRWCIQGILSEDANARLCAYVCLLLVPRQNGKNVVLEVVELYALFVLELPYILHSAHLAETSADHMARLWEAIESDEDLSQRCRRVVANGKERIYRTDGVTGVIRFRTRSKKVGRGGSPRMVVFDEALYLLDRQVSAMLPSLSAQTARREPPIIIYASSAPIDESEVLHRVRRAVVNGEMPDAWFAEWSAELPADVADLMEAVRKIVDDEAAILAANPGVPERISLDWVQTIERPQMSPEGFAVERLGVVLTAGPGDDLISDSAWALCADLESQPATAMQWALVITPDRKRATFGMAARRADGRVHVEVIDSQPGTGWIVAAARALAPKFTAPLRIHRTGPEAAYLAPLKEAGVEVVEVSSAEAAQATGQFIDFANTRQLAHLGQPQLDVALRGAVLRESSDGAVVWSQRNSQTEITPLLACTVALGGVPQEARQPALSQIQ